MPSKKTNFFNELKRRKVYRVAIVYAVTGWIIMQVAAVTFPNLNLPDWIITAVIVFVIIGFPVSLLVAWAFELSPEGIVRTSSPEARDNPLPAHKRKPFTGTITIVSLVVLLIAQFVYFQFIREKSSETVYTSTLPGNSIAVLPFKNMSGVKDNLYFSDGIMEAILNNLSRINNLKVVSRTSVEPYRDQQKKIPEIARELEVSNILEGSVQRIGNNVRITVQLISAENDEHIWATHYDRNLTDIFSIQSEIAETIAENLEVLLTSEELELIKNAPTTNLKSYDLYLQAQNMNVVSENSLNERIGLLKEAISLDPEFAWPYGLLGESFYSLSEFGIPRKIWMDTAFLYLNKSLYLDPTYIQAYLTKAGIYFWVFQDYDKAEENLLHALKYNPNSAITLGYLSNLYMAKGEYEKGIELRLKNLSLDKLNDKIEDHAFNLGHLLYEFDPELAYKYYLEALEYYPESWGLLHQLFSLGLRTGDYEHALQYAEKMMSVYSGNAYVVHLVGSAYMYLKEFEIAEKYFLKSLELTKNDADKFHSGAFMHRLGYVKVMLGKEEEGWQIIDNYRDTILNHLREGEILARGHGEYYDLAIIYTFKGDREKAYEYLEKARDNANKGAFYDLGNLLIDPMLDNLREDKKFREMLNEKIREQQEIKRIFREKLDEYHARKELKWLKLEV